MYERFTDRARKVMQLANQEARRFNHEYIGTEHILLGLIEAGPYVAVHVLKNLGIDLHKIRLEVEKVILSGPDIHFAGKRPQTPPAKKVIEYSIEEARNLNHNYVGTEHLLLGLLREQEGVAAQVLMNLGLKLEDVHRNIRQLLGENLPAIGNSPSPEDLIVEHVKQLPKRQVASSKVASAVDSGKCEISCRMWLQAVLTEGVLWGRRHSDLSTFLAGFVMTLTGSLVGPCLGLEDVNVGALLAGTSYLLAVAMAYWPYWNHNG